MAKTVMVDVPVHTLSGWDLKYALADHASGRETTLVTPNNGCPFAFIRIERVIVKGKNGEPDQDCDDRILEFYRDEDLVEILRNYPIEVVDTGFLFSCTVGSFKPFTSTDKNEAKGRAIVALCAKSLTVAVPRTTYK